MIQIKLQKQNSIEKWQMPEASPFNLVIPSQFSGRDAVGGMTFVSSLLNFFLIV